jgi:hypothetical protein
MGILDEAIKEHLELKRQHGAGESELKQLEDEAFGAAERPGDEEPASDALAEAPTAFMAQPEVAEADADEASSRRRPAPQIADLQEAPEQEGSSIEEPAEPKAPAEEEPAEEESPAMEHEAVAEPPQEAEPSARHSTEERQAIAEQPTETYDAEEELAGQEREAPSEEELVEEEMSEPRLAPVDTLAGIEEADVAPEVEVPGAGEESGDDPDDEFWDEKRLSDELDQALEAPAEREVEIEAAEPGEEADSTSETGEDSQSQQRDRDEDVLEETPDFLEEAPEDDQLWFEQKPPKDFDFDD